MLTIVQYNNDRYDMVIDYHVADLIRSGEIKGFCSRDGWVRLDVLPYDQIASCGEENTD